MEATCWRCERPTVVHFEGTTWCLEHWKDRRDQISAQRAQTGPIRRSPAQQRRLPPGFGKPERRS